MAPERLRRLVRRQIPGGQRDGALAAVAAPAGIRQLNALRQDLVEQGEIRRHRHGALVGSVLNRQLRHL